MQSGEYLKTYLPNLPIYFFKSNKKKEYMYIKKYI